MLKRKNLEDTANKHELFDSVKPVSVEPNAVRLISEKYLE